MQIIAAAISVDIQHLAAGVKPRHQFAFHGFAVKFPGNHAAGGDLGASVGPQLVGVITDGIMAAPWAAEMAAKLRLTTEQLGMKAGMLCGMLFPLVAVFVFLHIWKTQKEKSAV